MACSTTTAGPGPLLSMRDVSHRGKRLPRQPPDVRGGRGVLFWVPARGVHTPRAPGLAACRMAHSMARPLDRLIDGPVGGKERLHHSLAEGGEVDVAAACHAAAHCRGQRAGACRHTQSMQPHCPCSSMRLNSFMCASMRPGQPSSAPAWPVHHPSAGVGGVVGSDAAHDATGMCS